MPSPADLALVRRLEACDAWGNARCVTALGELYPEVGAAILSVAGGYAVYAGPDSPLTQAIGLGMNGRVSAADVDQMEAFYRERDTDAHIEVCALADPTLHALLAERGYRSRSDRAFWRDRRRPARRMNRCRLGWKRACRRPRRPNCGCAPSPPG
jgi:hypothetical protein